MVTEAVSEHDQHQGTAIDLSPAAKMGIVLSLRASSGAFPGPVAASVFQLTLAGPDYAYLHENWPFFASTDGQRYLQSDELRTTIAIQMGAGFEDALEAAFDESREQLVFRGTFPHPEFLQGLVEKFVASENPRSLRRVMLISDEDQNEATSASFHLPQAYDTSFPCGHCTGYRTENETCHMFVEVFHFAHRNDPSVCATVSFSMSAEPFTYDITTSDSRVEMYLTTSCRPQRTPFARPRCKLFTQFDTFFGVLKDVSPDGLEKLQAVSQGWRATVERHRRALPRRKLNVDIRFHGADPTVVTFVLSRWNGEYEQVLRMLVPHSAEQLSRMLCKHLRDALVELAFFFDHDSLRHPPQCALLQWDQSMTLDWTIRLFQSLKRSHVARMRVDTDLFGMDNLPVLMNAARFSSHVGTFDLLHFSDEEDAFTASHVVDLLHDPTAAASDKIVIEMRFLDAKDTTNVISEFCFALDDFEDAAFVDLPPTDRMKQFRQDLRYHIPSCNFRHNRHGKVVTTRVHTYRNAHTGEVLSAVRHSGTHHSSILFLKGHIALDDLRNKWNNDTY